MADTLQRKTRHRSPICRKRRRHSDCSSTIKADFRFQNVENLTLHCSTSTNNYAGRDTSSSYVTMATPISNMASNDHECLDLPACPSSSTSSLLCNDACIQHGCYSPLKRKSVPPLSPRLLISASDDDMKADSPDSGFESTTPTGSVGADYFDETLKADTYDDLSKSSSSSFDSCSLKESPICLIPPPKPEPPPIKKEPDVPCKWKDCSYTFANNRDLHAHLSNEHIKGTEERFCCLWTECKVYDKPSRSIGWLLQHVTTHTGNKRFKCIVGGCDASFGSQEGYQRHVASHFNEVNLPKAKPNNHNEKKFLVKRRRIKDQKKALANIHDSMDPRTMDHIVKSLVLCASPSALHSNFCETRQNEQVLCRRRCKNGSLWEMTSNNCWSKNTAGNTSHLFFETPRKRCRKAK